MTTAAIQTDWLHPPGSAAPGAPKGLVDLFVTPAQEVATETARMAAAMQAHWELALWVGLSLGVLLLLAVVLWRYRRPILLRWRLRQLVRLLESAPDGRPDMDRLTEALMWSLRRYFGQRGISGLDRRYLPARWRAPVAALDRLRFAAIDGSIRYAEMVVLLAELRRMSLLRHEPLLVPAAEGVEG